MKSSEQKLSLAIKLFENFCSDIILTKSINWRHKRVTFGLNDSRIIFIQYNDYEEYSYSIVFTSEVGDLSRFDNYDAHWEVKSKPHHYHPRFEYDPKNSPMTGNPEKDMEILCDFLRTHI